MKKFLFVFALALAAVACTETAEVVPVNQANDTTAVDDSTNDWRGAQDETF